MTPSHRTILKPTSVAPPAGKYSHAAQVDGGKLLFVAGQIATDTNGNLVGAGDAGAQTRQVFENLGAVLKNAGASFDDVVEFTYYIVGRSSVQQFLDARTAIFDEAYPDGDFPPATLLIVDGLVREDLLLEVSAVAALP